MRGLILIGNVSAAKNTIEAKVNKRVRFALELGDPDITVDLCKHKDKKSSKYDIFWKIAAQFFAEKAAHAVTAIDKHRHDTVAHLATVISVNDLLH
ncbi:uncharacterized protein LOC111111168 isoform X2 [Rhizophagus clarus]|uniref:Uncharacterized protein LOC111111168 isoform X2 n=1 Tax=Rhizophagus clarus TaxID=94130 RepID=A0A8H3QPJ4_9GLOM|nr:uncharacterized protein LOC111111168 isoform X2 [Rhizophagus clarus]